MSGLNAFEKFVAKNPNYHNLSRMEKLAFTFGFLDGFKAAQEEAGEMVEACESVIAHLAQSKEFDRLSPEDQLQVEVSLSRKLKAAIARAKGEVSNER